MPKSEFQMSIELAMQQLESASEAIQHARLALSIGRYHSAAQYLSRTLVTGAVYQAEGARNICASLAEQKRIDAIRENAA